MSEKLAARQSVRSLTMLLTAVYFVSYLTRINYGAVISEIAAAGGIMLLIWLRCWRRSSSVPCTASAC